MSHYIKGLDGIRGLAAITVVITHLNGWLYLSSIGLIPASLIPAIDGSAGVQAFFVLSGFLITMLLVKEWNDKHAISFQNFFIRRALRIFPLYFLLCFSSLVIFLLDPRTSNPTSLAYAFLYAYNFISSENYTPFLGHTWSLAVEEHFYLAWPLLFLWLFPLRRNLLISSSLAVILLAPILHFILVKENFFPGYFVGRWTFIAGANILAGCVLALVISDKTMYSPVLDKLTWLPFAALAFYCIPIALYGKSWTFDYVFSGTFRTVGIVIFLSWIVTKQDSIVARSLEFKPLSYFGRISYGIYIYQGLFLATGPIRAEGHMWPPSPSTGILAVVILAPLSFHFFEKPILSLKDALQRK